MVSPVLTLLLASMMFAMDARAKCEPEEFKVGERKRQQTMVSSDIPDQSKKHEQPAPGPAQSSHEFLENYYHSLFDEDGRLKEKSTKGPQIIHSYKAQVIASSNVINFNVSKVTTRESILKAEIRLKVILEFKFPQANQPITLGLYDNLTGKRVSRTTVFVGAVKRSGVWIRFTVRPLLTRWLRFPNKNRGVQVRVERKRRRLNNAPVVQVSVVTENSNGPFMLAYADEKPVRIVSHVLNHIRRNLTNGSMDTTQNDSAEQLTGSCSRHELRFKAKQFFGESLIAPLWYNAYDCAGSCELPNARGILSNHAYERLNAKRMGLQHNGAAARCVPTTLSSLGILYHKGSGHMVLRQLNDMVAMECGCR